MNDHPSVLLQGGTVAGSDLADGVCRFAGIPYAAAPVGPHRFRAPEPPAPYGTAVAPLDATAFGPPPPQFDADPAGLAPHRSGDDWLTVNVWTPALPDHGAGPDATATSAAAALPVMIWIYGGSYVNGCSADPEYDGAAFARAGVVFVSLNYRLGIEGFAHFPDAPSNRGLLDQIAALAWVRDNIAAFGGDPGNVTVFGESAGAGSIHALLAMPAASGLFRRAILQSPPTMVLHADLAGEVAAEFARVASQLRGGEFEPTAAAFAAIAPWDWPAIMAAEAVEQMRLAPRWGRAVSFVPPLCPVVDGEVLPADPWEATRSGAGAGVDLVIGSTAAEFLLFMAYNPQEVTAEKAAHRVALMGPEGGAESYAALMPEASAEQLFERVQSDRVFTTAALDLAAGHAAASTAGKTAMGKTTVATGKTAASTAGGATYVYVFDGTAVGGIGPGHTAELAPLFDVFDGDHGALVYPRAGDADRKLGALMRRAWAAFAASGDPNAAGDGLPAWGQWTATGPGSGEASSGEDSGLATRVWSADSATVAHPFARRWAAFAHDPARALDVQG